MEDRQPIHRLDDKSAHLVGSPGPSALVVHFLPTARLQVTPCTPPHRGAALVAVEVALACGAAFIGPSVPLVRRVVRRATVGSQLIEYPRSRPVAALAEIKILAKFPFPSPRPRDDGFATWAFPRPHARPDDTHICPVSARPLGAPALGAPGTPRPLRRPVSPGGAGRGRAAVRPGRGARARRRG
jgi:hypothetical protein